MYYEKLGFEGRHEEQDVAGKQVLPAALPFIYMHLKLSVYICVGVGTLRRNDSG